jgi:NNP family nitrate/nitrite transporter-like MFS transporter
MTDIKKWDVENERFWESEGKSIASRNLWISIPSLLCGFAVWIYWGIITVQMLNVGFPFTKAELMTLTAIAGLSGATLRIPSSFLIRLAGGRNTIFFTTALLMLPAIGTGLALQSKDTPLWIFQLMALLSGFGGGNFASSMSNISFFFPKKQQGLALGLNAGLGNFGVTTMQILIPLVMTMGIFGGDALVLEKASGTLIGKIPAGTETYLQNAGYIWLLLLVPLAFAGWFGMNNITDENVSPGIPNAAGSIGIVSVLLLIGLATSVFGIWLILPANAHGLGLPIPDILKVALVVPLVAGLTVFLMKQLPGKIKTSLDRQYKIFGNSHTWVMTVIYTMTFGSFIGFSAALPLTIEVVFGYQHLLVDGVMNHDTANPNGPSALMYSWMAPFIGALIRPVGGWISDKVGGALVTQICSVVMIACTLGAAYYMKLAYASATPEEYFIPFFVLFLVLFASTGIGNGSTFRTISQVFPKEQAGPALGWTSAIAAYGAFIMPQVLSSQIKATTPENALYGFAAFYAICVVLNFWVYLRKGVEHYNP